MSFYKIKIRTEDKEMSWYVRTRDKRCVRCQSFVQFNDEGKPISHTNSHFWGRGSEGTRFDPLNCDTLCIPCHQRWGGTYRDEYKDFKKKQLGEREYIRLEVRAHTYCKKDPKLQRMYVRELLKLL